MTANMQLAQVAKIVMGQSPDGSTYNKEGVGLPLLNGPTEFGSSHPTCTQFTSDSKRECLRGDLIFCVRGSTTGRMNWADKRYSLGRGVCSIRGQTRLETKFIKYCLDLRLENLLQLAGGGTFPNLTKDTILGFEIPFPETRLRIASILSAYDDLIENNTRRIAILEEMAWRIYEEWFVHFRFPGHEQVRMVESELGLIPEGWTVQTVEQTFQIMGGGTPSKAEPSYWDEGTINWYSPTDLTRSGTSFSDFSSDRITPLGLAKSSARLFPAYSVMLTSRATIGVVSVNTTQACTNQGFITCLPNEAFPLWVLFHWVKANVETFISLGTGATFKEITKGTFKGIKLVVPLREIANQFMSEAGPLMTLSLNLQRKNANLRTTRDLLLPKLISGELDVSHLPESESLNA